MEQSFKPAKYRGRPIWTVDAETDPFLKGRIPHPFIWGVYSGKEYWQFTDTDEMIDFLSEKKIIVYAHNGGKFDWHFLSEYIEDFEPLTIIAGRLSKFMIGECEFRDSFNIIPAPLSAYKKDEVDYAIFEESERNKPENWKIICEYLETDCVYLHEMVTQFIESYGMGLTQAGTAMKVWAKMSGIKKPQTSESYYADMSKYYYGGRVECFKTGIIEQKFSVVDIRSAYPYAMTFKHPWGTNYATYSTLDKDMSDDDIARSFITLNAKASGAFPLRGKTGLSFPNDGLWREFYITGWEFLAARDTGALDAGYNIVEIRKYLETIDFCEYVDYFFALKTEADTKLKIANEANDYENISYWSAQRLFAKLFLNSLYGKFASNPENYEEFMTLPASMIDGATSDGWGFCKLLTAETAVVNKPLDEEKRRYYDVAVAASITGFVRAYLWRNIAATNSTTLYCDTDSIAALDIHNINCSDGLGNWELEAECDYAAIGGKKLYAFRKLDGKFKIASKGVRLTPQEIIRIAQGETILYEPEAPTFSVKGGIKFTPRRVKMLD